MAAGAAAGNCGCLTYRYYFNIWEDKDTDKIIGSVTWSGNLRMMRLAEKLGLKKEAVYRKARIVDHTYYDSVSYGILRDEWF